eukprot:4885027-Pyramimonas_sp.AAC.1
MFPALAGGWSVGRPTLSGLGPQGSMRLYTNCCMGAYIMLMTVISCQTVTATVTPVAEETKILRKMSFICVALHRTALLMYCVGIGTNGAELARLLGLTGSSQLDQQKAAAAAAQESQARAHAEAAALAEAALDGV